MQKLISQIEQKIKEVAEQKALDAGYSGSWGDGGASKLLENLSYFMMGIESMSDSAIRVDLPVNVPKNWVKYFIKDEEEYKQYLELKKKYSEYEN